MTSQRVGVRSRVGEMFGFAMLAAAGIVWPALLLVDAFGGVR